MVTDYLDGALPPEMMQRLDEHFSTCVDCAEYLAEVRATIAATGRLDPDALSGPTRQALTELYRRSAGMTHSPAERSPDGEGGQT
jgi:anti-sigma factor RsiW